MKLTNVEELDSIREIWWHYCSAIRCMDAAGTGTASLNVTINGATLLHENDGWESTDESGWPLEEEVFKSTRSYLKLRLKELKQEFERFGVEVDWFHDLPEDVIRELWGDASWQLEAQHQERKKSAS